MVLDSAATYISNWVTLSESGSLITSKGGGQEGKKHTQDPHFNITYLRCSFWDILSLSTLVSVPGPLYPGQAIY